MKCGYKKIKIVLVFILLLAIPVYFAFTYYYSLSEADFLSKQFKLEARDQIELLTGFQEKSKALGPINFNHLFFLDNNTYDSLPLISCQASSFDLTSLILRC
jgi:hypothetical protein